MLKNWSFYANYYPFDMCILKINSTKVWLSVILAALLTRTNNKTRKKFSVEEIYKEKYYEIRKD